MAGHDLCCCPHATEDQPFCTRCGAYSSEGVQALKTTRFSSTQRANHRRLIARLAQPAPCQEPLKNEYLKVRSNVLEFLVNLRKSVGFGTGTLVKAVTILDPFLANDSARWAKAYFYGVVALNLAAKLNEVDAKVLTFEELRHVAMLASIDP
jgi:hypothetical protein